ncbi:TM1812 family CRISPR-associated protein [Anaerovibrio lipolyticus]|uniref:TM1812 family CRISPR-associated protein n=1 Tax=Anaerovibrio lipolyticus TaxID=82374 RepID=UPI0026EFBF6B|nr:TM1812 family CRISPR-associated protein [Anaerovibrio lipolyticus]MBE6105330.1 hypothetical protein [Anaerovibrio lipolyticus]
MRKIFLSTVILNKIDFENPTNHASRDFDLHNKKYIFPISYLLDDNISADDEIVIITGMNQTDTPKENYKHLVAEMQKILDSHNAKAEFIVVDELDAKDDRELMDSLSFSEFMKEVADIIKDDDQIYADMTYGLKSYTLAMFIALNYVVKSCQNVGIKKMIYAQFYKGDTQNPGSADIIDITPLFRLNCIVNQATAGKKQEMDQLLSFMIG